jgi:hypothetical protein
MKIFGNNNKFICYFGRTTEYHKIKKAILFAYSCSGFKILANFCKGFELCFQIESEINVDHEFQYAKLFIDGIYLKTIQLTRGLNKIGLDSLTLYGKHEIKFLKINEASICKMALIEIDYFRVELMEKEDKESDLIMFFGDSLTCGYGILGNPTITKFSTKDEDSTITYAFLASQEIQYECTIVACSGISMSRVFCPYGVSMLDQYDTVDGVEKNINKESPKIAVINLSSNDNSVIVDGKFDNNTIKQSFKEFEDNYMELVNYIFKKNKECIIVSCYNIGVKIDDRLVQSIKNITEKINTIKGKEQAFVLEFAPDQNGANGHPCAEAHKLDGYRLSSFIKGMIKL